MSENVPATGSGHSPARRVAAQAGEERDDAVGRATTAAVEHSQAVAEFDTGGRLLRVNDRFSDIFGYPSSEVLGKSHRMFCEPGYAAGDEHADFWRRLGAGELSSGKVKRLGKGARPLWLQAAYAPVLAENGVVVKVVMVATDVTAATMSALENLGKVQAIDRSQAVIEFSTDGRVLTANKNFLDVMGYALAEVQGKHHRTFCEREYAASLEYADFWDRLSSGQFEAGEYKRLAKGGQDVWLQATYNPVFDEGGSVLKIIKFASDVTQAKSINAEYLGKVAAIDRAQAVIEFDLQGQILSVNRNFCDVMGVAAADVVGKHHRIFCDPEYTATDAYLTFWERLGAGEFVSGEFKRFAKGGREVWLQATYNPVLNPDGKPVKVVKFASDVTAMKFANAEIAGKLDAVERAQAVIEFDLEGVVTSANENFLRSMGYSLREIVGQHHSTFCTPDYVRSVEYRDFWMRLSKGELISGRFHRVGKFERDVHIQASYNPIMDLNGEVVKVVKYAYDITAQVEHEQRVAAGTASMTEAVQQLTQSISDIGRSSTVATELAQETHSNAELGVEALRASLEAIQLIQTSSSSISKIVRLMGEIANQTNLLAFNASIEAARAGEHGVGFSIVAGEVRKLAERSSDAAQQIGKLIEESEDRVNQGSEVSKRAESAFERIVASVAKTNEAIRIISGCTRTQQVVSATVNELIEEMAADRGGN